MTFNKFIANAPFLAMALILSDAALGENSAGTEVLIASKKLTMSIPNQWKSTTSGSQWSARFLDGRFQFTLERLGAASCRVGRSRYAEESLAAAPRIILHLHSLNSEGMILQYFVRINQHDNNKHRRAL